MPAIIRTPAPEQERMLASAPTRKRLVTRRMAAAGCLALLVCGATALLVVWIVNPLAFMDALDWWMRSRAGLTTRAVSVDGQRWVYDEGGVGDTLVLLHGFAGSRTDWYPLLRFLPRQYRLVIPDLPGWGESERDPAGDYSARAQADRLAVFLAAIGATHVHLVGHSMGGKISGLVAARHPDRVERLTLIANSGVRFELNPFAREILAGGNPFNVSTRADWERLLAQAFERPPPLPGRIVDALIASNLREHEFLSRTLGELRRGRYRYALEPALRTLSVPVHVIWCRHDRMLDVSSIDTMRPLIRNGRYDVIEEGCGHMPMFERPATLAALILE